MVTDGRAEADHRVCPCQLYMAHKQSAAQHVQVSASQLQTGSDSGQLSHIAETIIALAPSAMTDQPRMQFVRRMGLKSDKPLVMVKASAVQLYTGPSEAEAVQQGYVPAVIRDIMDTGLQARCFLMFEDGAVCPAPA